HHVVGVPPPDGHDVALAQGARQVAAAGPPSARRRAGRVIPSSSVPTASCGGGGGRGGDVTDPRTPGHRGHADSFWELSACPWGPCVRGPVWEREHKAKPNAERKKCLAPLPPPPPREKSVHASAGIGFRPGRPKPSTPAPAVADAASPWARSRRTS